MRQGWAGDTERASLPPAPPAKLIARRRAALCARWPGVRLIIPAGQPRLRAGDSRCPFRPDSNYVWLTGDQTPGGVLVLEPAGAEHEATLYVQPPSGRDDDSFWLDGAQGEPWVGPRPGLTALSERLGVACAPRADLDAIVDGPRPDHECLVLRHADPQIDAAVAAADAEDELWLRASLAELRLVKDDWEIGQLRAAVQLSVCRVRRCGPGAARGRGRDTCRRAGGGGGVRAPGTGGRRWPWLPADRRSRLACHDPALDPQRRATAPGRTDRARRGRGDRTLYTADITRTLPVSGRFTAVQREVYEIVFAAQQAALAEIAPGKPFRGYHRAISQVLANGLEQLGVLPVSAAESLREDCGLHRRWTLCAPGHMVGLDVHDCGDAPAESYIDGLLRPGNVLTVEPGLYFQRYDELAPATLRGLGIRIEDDVLVTPGGCELLSETLPRAAGDIEEWLLTGGLPGRRAGPAAARRKPRRHVPGDTH